MLEGIPRFPMNFPTLRPAAPRDRRAFTLIELLVVIVIISILAGLLLPVVSKVTNSAYKTSTKAAELQIVGAINSFQTDYGMYPVPTTSQATGTPGTSDLTFLPSVSNAPLFTVLRATEPTGTTQVNTRAVVYFQGQDAKSPTYPKNGFVPTTATSAKSNSNAGGGTSLSPGDYVDSWGNRYGIVMDTDYNNVVANPYSSTAAGADDATVTDGTKVLRFGVAVWTYGTDGKLGNNGTLPTDGTYYDDVVSWQ